VEPLDSFFSLTGGSFTVCCFDKFSQIPMDNNAAMPMITPAINQPLPRFDGLYGSLDAESISSGACILSNSYIYFGQQKARQLKLS
ncbi:MAG: hypothetical protein K2X29_09350, partial [Candidatus Obscuribacterales bacterium]|nr:hypothetical protein [Candidatus Obscuribacterales bacterium]